MDTIDLLYYGLDILSGKENNDLDTKDIRTMKVMLDKLVTKYLQEKGKEITIAYVDMYCKVCHEEQEHKLIHSDGDRICECNVCGNMEVI